MNGKEEKEPWYIGWIGQTMIGLVLGFIAAGIRLWIDGSTGGGGSTPSAWEKGFNSLATLGITFGVSILVGTRVNIERMKLRVKEHNRELRASSELDRDLLDLQARLREVQADRSVVFQSYCSSELKRFLARVKRAAQVGELLVDEHHFRTIDEVLEAFGDGQCREYRGVWRVEAGEKLFDAAWQEYMKRLISRAKQRKGPRVRIYLLLVVDETTEVERAAMRVVLGFLENQKKTVIDYNVITATTYDEVMKDSGLGRGYEDFGIYGEKLLYRTESYEPKRGVFSEDEGLIEDHLGTHIAAMESARGVKLPTDLDKHDDIERFVHADLEEVEDRETLRQDGTSRGELVKIPNEGGVELDGILYRAEDSQGTVIHVHGCLGNFYNQQFIRSCATMYTGAGMDFLSLNMQAHDGIAEGYFGDGEMRYVGGAVVEFSSCLEDIRSAVMWAKGKTKTVYLQGHSMGCDRVTYFMEEGGRVEGLILLSPCDSRQLHVDWLEKAGTTWTEQREMLKQLNEEEGSWNLLKKDAYGLAGEEGWTYPIPTTRAVLRSIMEGPVGRVFAVEKPVKCVRNTAVMVYLGAEDPIRGASVEEMTVRLKKIFGDVDVIEGSGGHNLEGCEETTVAEIAMWLRKRGGEDR